jgi:hypothetical protein
MKPISVSSRTRHVVPSVPITQAGRPDRWCASLDAVTAANGALTTPLTRIFTPVLPSVVIVEPAALRRAVLGTGSTVTPFVPRNPYVILTAAVSRSIPNAALPSKRTRLEFVLPAFSSKRRQADRRDVQAAERLRVDDRRVHDVLRHPDLHTEHALEAEVASTENVWARPAAVPPDVNVSRLSLFAGVKTSRSGL